MSNLTNLLRGLFDITQGRTGTRAALIWQAYEEERERLFGAAQRAAIEALAQYDDLELARSLYSYVHAAREALRHQDFDGWECMMDAAEEYAAEIARRADS